ncbi:probable Na+/H+ antiporter protein [Fulvimarina pelagi HTCC2506]|uniref:Probable Na+/H+ antiporter protein n=1 Tax=Fulvimarina pelagi HTCC2506 TaxID=314231 RepID=Q0G5R0_9HYPH|nr:potassium/proton antiporter [Fulvimarina pelagi]EAU43004.1 probable Na+/H+ antiporter protein [Fulvimarina pelagi HTCC2506]
MLEDLYLVILVGTVLVLLAAFSSLLASRFGTPLLLLFLSVGLIAGTDGLGLEFDNAGLAYFIGTLALAVILFDSGFQTPISTFRQAAAPALTLATIGVLGTSILFGIAADWLLGIGLFEGMLLGAIVGSTDAAAVFFLLKTSGIVLRDRIRSLLEIESGTNDPMAIFLTIALVELLSTGGGFEQLGLSVLLGFVQQMGLGLVAGLLGGRGIAFFIAKLSVDRGLLPILILALSIAVFALTGALGGSGFLAVYVAGLYAGNAGLKRAPSIRRFQEGMTWLAQIIMFLILGLLATPRNFDAILIPGIILALFLIFIARPVAVSMCLWPFGFRRRETLFVSWVGLRGAVSILLAILPILGEIEGSYAFFNIAFVIVLTSLLLQGWTLASVARWLRLTVPPRIGPVEKFELELPGAADHELLSYRVVEGSPVATGSRVPRWARPSLVIRNGRSMRYQYAGRLQPGDHVYLFISPRFPPLLDRLFASRTPVAEDDEEFFGEFTVNPDSQASSLAEAYGFELDDTENEMTIAEVMSRRLGGYPSYGDRAPIGPVELIVRETDADGVIVSAGLSLSPPDDTLLTFLRTTGSGRSALGRLFKGTRSKD